jgi:hypothetical protein
VKAGHDAVSLSDGGTYCFDNDRLAHDSLVSRACSGGRAQSVRCELRARIHRFSAKRGPDARRGRTCDAAPSSRRLAQGGDARRWARLQDRRQKSYRSQP